MCRHRDDTRRIAMLRALIARADDTLGRVVWMAVALALLGAAGFVAYAGIAGFGQIEGPERWAVLALCGALAALFVAFARRAGRRAALSDALVDDA